MIVEEAIDKGFQCNKEGEGCHNFKKDTCCDGLKCFNVPLLPIVGLVGVCRKQINSGGKCQKEGGICMGMVNCCEGLECTSINPILPIFGIKTCIKPQSKPELKNEGTICQKIHNLSKTHFKYKCLCKLM